MKYFRICLIIVLLIALLTGCMGGGKKTENGGAEASEAESEALTDQSGEDLPQEDGDRPADSAHKTGYPITDSYMAYVDAKGVIITKITDGLAANPDTALASLNLLGVVMIDMVMLPVSFFGMGQEAVASGLGFIGATGVEYRENGNSYNIKHTDSEGNICEIEGTYDEAADTLTCSASSNGDDSLYAEYRKTSFGYVGQYYVINDDGTTSAYQISIQGEDGALGISSAGQYSPLTGSETVDFPRDCEEWYAVSGNTITGVMADGTQLNFGA